MKHYNPDIDNFEAHVIEVLAELQADMKSLVGNGQPGRITKIETNVFRMAILLAVVTALTLGPGLIGLLLGG